LNSNAAPKSLSPKSGVTATDSTIPQPNPTDEARKRTDSGVREENAGFKAAIPDGDSVMRSPQQSPGREAEGVAWTEIVDRLPVNGLVRELLNNTTLEYVNDKAIGLVLDEACAKLLSKEREAALRQALETHYGRVLQLTVRIGAPSEATPVQQKARQRNEAQQAAIAAIDSDPNVRALREQFSARVNLDSVRPIGTARQT
jgi:DNA polymerase-3 subunit gamma/tau